MSDCGVYCSVVFLAKFNISDFGPADFLNQAHLSITFSTYLVRQMSVFGHTTGG